MNGHSPCVGMNDFLIQKMWHIVWELSNWRKQYITEYVIDFAASEYTVLIFFSGFW